MRILVVVLLLFQTCIAREFGPYSTSYVHLTASNAKTGESVDICANYQQYKQPGRLLAKTREQAVKYELKWWREPRNTQICPFYDKPVSYLNGAVPLDYRIVADGTECSKPFVEHPTSFRNASQFQENQIIAANGSAIVFLVDRGRRFVQGWRDFLFSDFHDPYIDPNNSLPTFFIYRQDFIEKIMSLTNHSNDNDIQLQFHRPPSPRFDPSMIVIWLLAMTCVSVGGVWAFHRHRNGKDMQLAEHSTQLQDGDSNGFCARHANYIAICVLMSMLIVVIMLGYYFRPILVLIFNVMLVLFGTASVYDCWRAILSNFSFSESDWYQKKIEWAPGKKKLSYTSAIMIAISFAICLTWFVTRKSAFAFVLLDFINVTLCLHILKSLRLPSLKWISILMVCMFVYDAVMVFATPFWTKNGCSVMLEVATGLDCSVNRANASGYPLPPIEFESAPEKFPMLMQVMHFDPMTSCIDLSVERNYQMTILGLGDIIIPGYLISHSFTMNGFGERARLFYGITGCIGYGVGLIATFVGLTAMQMAQPALIYLVPFTLLPICMLALIRGEFKTVWNGVPFEKPILENESNRDDELRSL